MKPERLFKHTITIWTENNVSGLEDKDLVHAADDGEAYGEGRSTEVVGDHTRFPNTDFFDLPDPDPYPKPWKIGFRPVEGATMYDSKNGIVPWEIVTAEMNKEAQAKTSIEEPDEDEWASNTWSNNKPQYMNDTHYGYDSDRHGYGYYNSEDPDK